MSLKSVITLANSIIGVSILAMPFCFKQCGVVLATVLLLLSGLMVKLTCHLLLKSALLCRRRNYELLAFHAFGGVGKLSVEICMIGFMLGTCVAFFVVMGDLAPPIIAAIIGSKQDDDNNNSSLRTYILVFLGLFVALPLALLRNVNNLVGISTASIGFYLCVLVYIVSNALSSIVDGKWIQHVNLWRPQGLFQCLPIFCMALACQPQVFEIYEVLPDPSSWSMNAVVRGAVNLCTAAYVSVGIFGYIALPTTDIGGNILAELPGSAVLQLLKLGFVLSVAISFPLMVFPCRTAIDSLLFRSTGYSGLSAEATTNYIPPSRFNGITVFVLLFTLAIGILVPDIEFVLGIVGSTIGCAVCTIFPALIFTRVSNKNTTERIAAQVVLVVGITILVLGTFVNLNEASKGHENQPSHIEPIKIDEHNQIESKDDVPVKDDGEEKSRDNDDGDTRLEPPGPEPPDTKDHEAKSIENKEISKVETDAKDTNNLEETIKLSNESDLMKNVEDEQEDPVAKHLERNFGHEDNDAPHEKEVVEERKVEEKKDVVVPPNDVDHIELEKKAPVMDRDVHREVGAAILAVEETQRKQQQLINLTLKHAIENHERLEGRHEELNNGNRADVEEKKPLVIDGKIEKET